MKQWYVYEDWTTEPSPRCFYVGKGDEGRTKRLKRGKFHTEVVERFGQDRRIVFESSVERETFDEERRLIAERHTHPRDPEYNGIGVNRTRGGQGNSGRIVTEETRRRISESKKGKTPNKVWTQEERDATSRRMSLLHKGKTISEEQKQKLRDRMNDPEVKSVMIEKVTRKLRKKYEDPAFCQKIIETRVRGESSRSPFTDEEVRQMRDEWERVDKTVKGGRYRGVSPVRQFCQKWADVKGVTNQAVYNIVTRKTWRHLP